MTFEQLGAGGADHEERDGLSTIGEVLQEREHRLIRPMQVLEHEHGGVLLGDVFQEPSPRGEQLLALGGEVASIPSSGSRRWRNQGRSSPSGSTTSSLAEATSGASDSRIPAWAFTISPSAQNVMPSP